MEKFKNYILRKLNLKTKAYHDSEIARLSAIIEIHIDDINFLLRRAGIDYPHKVKALNHVMDRKKVLELLG